MHSGEDMAKGHRFPVFKNSTLSWIYILNVGALWQAKRHKLCMAPFHFVHYFNVLCFYHKMTSITRYLLSFIWTFKSLSKCCSFREWTVSSKIWLDCLYRSVRGRKFNGYIKNSKPIQGAWLCKELLRDLKCWLNFPPWCESQQTKAKYIFETLPKRLLQSGEKQLTRFSTIYLRLPLPFHQVVDMSAPFSHLPLSLSHLCLPDHERLYIEDNLGARSPLFHRGPPWWWWWW